MKFGMRGLTIALASVLFCLSGAVSSQVAVTTYHNDISRSGLNSGETLLSPTTVNVNQFGKLYTVAVDGYVYAQPLYLPNVTIAGGVHNVLYVVTEHDSIYAIDADSGTIYLQVSLIPPGGRTVNPLTDIGAGCTDQVPEIGITGTPVIDATTGTLYVVAKSVVGGAAYQYLHALDIGSLTEKFGGPVSITAAVNGTGENSTNGIIHFNEMQENNRPALLLQNGHVIISWGSHCDFDPWHGWLMSYNSATLTQEAAFNATPNGSNGGIWMSGGGPAADAAGNTYASTGNGNWDGNSDFADSIIKFGPPASGTFPVLDYFTPWDQLALQTGDIDVSAGAPVLLPALPSGQQLLALVGKNGTMFELDTSNLGKYCPDETPACTNSDPQIFFENPNATTGTWGAPAYWNGNLYWGGSNDNLQAFSFNTTTGKISTAATTVSSTIFGYPPPTPSVSANGATNGIVWVLDGSEFASTCVSGANCQILYAFDASNLGVTLYSSSQAANNRDVPGSAVKFATPTIANGKVYVGSQYAVSAYGQIASAPPTAVSVALSSADNIYALGTAGAEVTGGGIDGSGNAYDASMVGTSIPWSGSNFTIGSPGANSGASDTTINLSVGNYTTLKILASGADGNQLNQSFVVTYTDGTTSTFTQSISDWYVPSSNPGESIVVTVPYKVTATGATQQGPFYIYGYSFALNPGKSVASLTLPANKHVTVLAVDLIPASGATPTAATPTFSPTPGTYTGTQTVRLSDTTTGAAIYYTTNGTTPTTASTKYAGTAISVSATTTINAIAVASGYNNSGVASGTYTIATTTTPISVNLSSEANLYGLATSGTPITGGGLDGHDQSYAANLIGTSLTWAGSTFAFASAGLDSALTSTTVTLPAGNYTTLSLLGTGVNGSQANQTFVVTYSDGTTSTFTQSLSDWFTPQNYPGETEVLTMAYRVIASGATQAGPFYLYGYSFSLNSAKTVASLTLPANADVVVLAVDLTPSGATTPTAATPTFSPAPGTYTGTQSVSLSDTTTGAAIYYTTNGTQPTTASTKYAGTAISVSATETINAIAVASGYNNSAVATGAYTIAAASTPISVNLSSESTLYGLATSGTPITGGGLDGHDQSYAANLIGTSLTWSGATFAFATAGPDSALTSTTVTLPAGTYATLSLLGSAVNGNQPNQSFIVTYTDGTTTTFTQSLSDWYTPQNYSGETEVLTMAYRIIASGATQGGPLYLYGYSFSLNSAKTVRSLTLPANTDVVVLAIDLTPASGATPTVATPTFSPAPGTYTGTQSVSLSDTTTGAALYYTTNGTTPTTASTKYAGTAISVNTTTTINAIAVASGYNNSSVASGTYTISPLPAALTPTFSPTPGTYTGTQTVTLSDATPGAVIYYTTNGSTPTTASAQYIGALDVSATTTLRAIAVASGYSNSGVASGTYTINPVGTSPVSVSLTAEDNLYGLALSGTAVTGGGMDGYGQAYAANLIGTSLTWAGSTFEFASPGPGSALTSGTITLPAGNYSTLSLLGTGVNGDQANQTFVVTYSDGTTSTFTQSLSDWFTAQNYSGESLVLSTAYRIIASGATQAGPFNVYGYSFALNNAKTPKTLSLPNNSDVVVLAVDLTP